MNSKRYLTIREVSKLVGISPQAIYQQVDKKLKRYVQLVNGKKMLKFEVLKEIYNYNVESTNQSKVDNQFNNDNMKEEIVFLRKQVEFLQEELRNERINNRIKDQQITKSLENLTVIKGIEKQNKLITTMLNQRPESFFEKIKKIFKNS